MFGDSSISLLFVTKTLPGAFVMIFSNAFKSKKATKTPPLAGLKPSQPFRAQKKATKDDSSSPKPSWLINTCLYMLLNS